MSRSEVKRSFFNGAVTWFFGERGAHFRCPGFLYTRGGNVRGFSIGRSWRVLGVVAICHNETRRGTLKHCKPAGWSIRFARLTFSFRKADNYVS